MEADYPAAHSMDTFWFAVDAAGHVAMFISGENGHAPDGETNDVSSELWELRKSIESDEENGWDRDELCRDVGLYAFDYNEDYDPIAPYFRSIVPEVPLHIDQLPPELRERCRSVCFDVRFDQIERLQPLDFLHCVFWYDDRIAYLCGDGITVKPLPGKDDEFAAFVREFSERDPNEASRLIFDGPTE
jgi:hypothetical protein